MLRQKVNKVSARTIAQLFECVKALIQAQMSKKNPYSVMPCLHSEQRLEILPMLSVNDLINPITQHSLVRSMSIPVTLSNVNCPPYHDSGLDFSNKGWCLLLDDTSLNSSNETMRQRTALLLEANYVRTSSMSPKVGICPEAFSVILESLVRSVHKFFISIFRLVVARSVLLVSTALITTEGLQPISSLGYPSPLVQGFRTGTPIAIPKRSLTTSRQSSGSGFVGRIIPTSFMFQKGGI
jgi:hypothetical protein